MSLGLGSVIAAAFESARWLAVISQHKGSVFLAVGGLLAFNYLIAVVRPRQVACAAGDVCHVDRPAMRLNRVLFWTSVGIYVAAVVFTYGALWWVRMQG